MGPRCYLLDSYCFRLLLIELPVNWIPQVLRRFCKTCSSLDSRYQKIVSNPSIVCVPIKKLFIERVLLFLYRSRKSVTIESNVCLLSINWLMISNRRIKVGQYKVFTSATLSCFTLFFWYSNFVFKSFLLHRSSIPFKVSKLNYQPTRLFVIWNNCTMHVCIHNVFFSHVTVILPKSTDRTESCMFCSP